MQFRPLQKFEDAFVGHIDVQENCMNITQKGNKFQQPQMKMFSPDSFQKVPLDAIHLAPGFSFIVAFVINFLRRKRTTLSDLDFLLVALNPRFKFALDLDLHLVDFGLDPLLDYRFLA